MTRGTRGGGARSGPAHREAPPRRPPARLDVRALGDWRSAGGAAALHERLADALEGALLDGRLPLAVPLPSERSLAAAAGVSRATVTEAYGVLRERGWLRTRRGARGLPTLPAALAEGLAPRDGAAPGDDVIDLVVAGPAAPAEAYRGAIERAHGRLGARLATTGVGGMGLAALRARIAERHTAQGLPTVPEEILLTSGARAALGLALGALLPVRAPALAELPSYPGALDLLRDRGRPVVGWPVEDGWDAARFAGLVRARGVRVAYVVPDFHNPTGRQAGAAERAAVADAARAGGVLLVADETMRELDLREPGRARPEPPLAAVAPGALTLGSLSKVLWGGLRVGWLRAPRDVIDRVAGHPLAPALAPAPLDELIADELLGELDALLEQRLATLRARCDHLAAALDALPGVSARRPDGGLSAWVSLEHASSTRLVREAAAAGVRLLPGGRFSPDAPLDRRLRIPFALPEPVLDEALGRLAPLLPPPPGT